MNSMIRHAAVATAATLTAIALAACGSTSTPATAEPKSPASAGTTVAPPGATADDASPDAASGQHNAADVAFTTGMIPHHQQAVTMSQMAKKQATNPKVKSLAEAIQAAQGPEIKTMTGWLTAWGAPAPTSGGHDMSNMDGDDMDGDDMGGQDMGGMMTDEQMKQLGSASGAQFDRMWLQQMVAHHKGAVEMSDVELRDGQNADAKKLAQQIIDAQKQEITVMEQLLPTITG